MKDINTLRIDVIIILCLYDLVSFSIQNDVTCSMVGIARTHFF